MELQIRWRLLACCCAVLVAGCTRNQPAPSGPVASQNPSRPSVVVTSRPLFDFARELCGSLADVSLVVPDGQRSRDWQPAAENVRTMQSAGLLLISGAGYEPWRVRVSLPQSRVRDTAAGYYDQFIRIPDALVHQHGPDGQHSHPGTVWATWLDPELAVAQMEQVARHCAGLIPDHAEAIERNAAKLKGRMDPLQARLSNLHARASKASLTLYSDGPYYQYLARRLGLELHYLHWDDQQPDVSDSERAELTERTATSADGKLRMFLLSTTRADAVAEIVRSAGLSVVRIDLCESPAAGDVTIVSRLEQNLAAIEAALP